MTRATSLGLLRRSISILLLTKHLGATATSLSFFFNFSDPATFDPGDLHLERDAYASKSSIILAKDPLTGNATSRSGRVSYKHPVRLRSNETGEVSSFSASFCFVIDGSQTPIDTGGGLALFFAPYPSKMPQNSEGAYLGLFNATTAAGGGDWIVAVEVDSHGDPGWDPTMSPHIAVDINTLDSGKNSYKAADELVGGVPYVLQVEYSDVTTDLLVVLHDYSAAPGAPLISLKKSVDFSEFLSPEVTIGISAATGGSNIATPHVLWWSFGTITNHSNIVSSLTPAPDTPGNLVVPGSPPPSQTDPPSSGVGRHNRSVLVGIVVGAILFVVTATVIALLCALSRSSVNGRRNGISRELLPDEELLPISIRKSPQSDELVHEGQLIPSFLSNTILLWTCLKKVIGSICLFMTSKKELRNCIAFIAFMEQLRHPNILRIRQWSRVRDRILLVYESMPNGCLRDHLVNPERLLTWPMRYKIALGIGSALEYLHSQPHPMPHESINTDTVILDESFTAKLRVLFEKAPCYYGAPQHKYTSYYVWWYTTEPIVSPVDLEAMKAGLVSDVYSFGALLLEIVCGRERHQSPCLVEHVWTMHSNGAILDAVDERLNGEFDREEVERMLLVGLLCTHPDQWQRPSIAQALRYLRLEDQLPSLPPMMPCTTPNS